MPCSLHPRWRDGHFNRQRPRLRALAQRSGSKRLVVVGVEFCNGSGVLGNHPFPAGLNDCDVALQWTDQNRERLGISAIVLSGESGGGNLALATTLAAKRAGRIDSVQGVYALCPYISGAYADPPEIFCRLRKTMHTR